MYALYRPVGFQWKSLYRARTHIKTHVNGFGGISFATQRRRRTIGLFTFGSLEAQDEWKHFSHLTYKIFTFF